MASSGWLAARQVTYQLQPCLLQGECFSISAVSFSSASFCRSLKSEADRFSTPGQVGRSFWLGWSHWLPLLDMHRNTLSTRCSCWVSPCETSFTCSELVEFRSRVPQRRPDPFHNSPHPHLDAAPPSERGWGRRDSGGVNPWRRRRSLSDSRLQRDSQTRRRPTAAGR